MPRLSCHPLFGLLAGALLAGCDQYPRDADDMTARATDAAMWVGASHDPPHVVVSASGAVTGEEAAVIERFADARGYRVEWMVRPNDGLMHALEQAHLHAVIGGHDRRSPWRSRVAWSRPRLVRGRDGVLQERRIALPPGQSGWQLAFDRHLIEREHAR